MAVARGMKCAARAAPVSAVFTLGDNFYGNGVVSVDDAQFEFKWASVYADAALDVPWYPALGDHDQCGDVDAQVACSRRFWARRTGAVGGSATDFVLTKKVGQASRARDMSKRFRISCAFFSFPGP